MAYILILLGSALYAIGTCLFIFPHDLLLGGTSGISVILSFALPFSPGLILSGINFALLLLALILLGRSMAVRTILGSAATTVFIALLDTLIPDSFVFAASPFLAALLGGAVIAVASAILFAVDASSGGTDIIALIIRKYKDIRIGRALLITDCLIVIVGGILSGWEIAIASVVGLLMKTLGIDAAMAWWKKRKA